MRKPRTDSELDYLPDEQREQLMDWILGRVPYRQIVALLKDNYKVSTSLSAVSRYWRKWGAEHWKARRRNAIEMAAAVADEARAAPGQFSEAAASAIEERVFAIAMDPNGDGKDLKDLATILIKGRDQQIRQRDQEIALERLALDREKYREAIKSAQDRGLDALFVEIEGNPEAEALFHRLKAAVMSAADATEPPQEIGA